MSVTLDRFPAASPPPAAVVSVAPRDRFVAFAFAAADLLVEAGLDGRILYAAGAFNTHFGAAQESFVASPIARLVAGVDQQTLELALALLAQRGRLAPVVVRLADRSQTPMALSGLILPGGRICLTFGRLPSVPLTPDAERQTPDSFAHAAEARLRAGGGGHSAELNLVELRGWREATCDLPRSAQQALQTEITEALMRVGGPGTVTTEVAGGRYGLLSNSKIDLDALAGALGDLLHRSANGRRTRIDQTEFALDPDGLTGPQAARALRFALSRFAQGGTAATHDEGFDHGLAGFIESAGKRARAVRATIVEHRFRLAFQPIVTLANRRIHHFEALLRPIATPGNPIHNTQDFVTFSEAVGLSEELDGAVLQQAIAAADASPRSAIAVNISGLSLQSPGFQNHVLGVFDRRPDLAERILIELTETADIEELSVAAEGVQALRSANIRICIDDFGSGAAAFRYLRELRVDYVKLDGAYVRRAPRSAREHGFILSMVELANFVGAKSIAEMIETEEQARLMLELGCEFGQGYLFGRPGLLPGS